MILDRLEIINEEFHAAEVNSLMLDRLLADGWRHFGTHFFRYNYGLYLNEIRAVLPLRVRITDLILSKSQQRTLRRNANLQVEIQAAQITPEIHDLFERHKARFKSSVPDSIYDFISRDSKVPTACQSVIVRETGRLVAASFFDTGENSVSSIYAMFDPTENNRSLGIFTMLKEMEFALETGRNLYYHGYAYEGESFYDYKKRFNSIEIFDWKGNWQPKERRP